MGGGGSRHSSVDLSAPTILRSRVRIPSTPSMLLPFLYYTCHCVEKRTKINEKEAEFGSYFTRGDGG